MKNRGFTLIELLISITLLTLTLTIIMGGLRLSINAWKSGEEKIETYQKVKNIFRILSNEIESCFLFYYKKGNNISSKRYLAFEGTKERFSITSYTKGLGHDKKLDTGIREITYFLDKGEKKMNVLKRRERFIHPDSIFAERNSLEVIIIRDIASLKLNYYLVGISKKDGKELPLGWFDKVKNLPEFEKKENTLIRILPRAIEVTIELFEKKGDNFIKSILPPFVFQINTGKKIIKDVTI